MAQVPCTKVLKSIKAPAVSLVPFVRQGTKWRMDGQQLRSVDRKGDCLTRSPSGEALDLVKCKEKGPVSFGFRDSDLLGKKEAKKVGLKDLKPNSWRFL